MAKPTDSAVKEAAKAIRSSFPEFEVESILPEGEGMDVVLFSSMEISYSGSQNTRRSPNNWKLKYLYSKASDDPGSYFIPNFSLVGKQQTNDFPFIGYKKIRGDALQSGALAKLNSGSQDTLIKEIALFLTTPLVPD